MMLSACHCAVSACYLTRLLPSALARLQFADLGADVVKLEVSPRGDYLRRQPASPHGREILSIVQRLDAAQWQLPSGAYWNSPS
jgi:hypothetical protein